MAEARKTPSSARESAGAKEAKTVAELRAALRKNLIRPMGMVLISRDRIEEVLGEAVEQGRVTARDAQRITAGLVKRGQRQTSDVLKDLENLLERGRRAAGVGPSLPIAGYEELTAAQIKSRLGSLTPAELRKVRDHERRNAKRKTVLDAIDRKLG
jgi:polyhydroxyalkanoate synthesis regulator phasin